MKNPYIPSIAKIVGIINETPDTKTFKLGTECSFKPGQFVELSVFGYGEAPISISGEDNRNIDLSIRAVGNVTKRMHRMNVGEYVGIRGPFGNGWPLEKAKGKNLLIIAGGIGLAPLKPVVDYVCKNRNEFKEVTLLYGARKPSLMLFKYEFDEWRSGGVRLVLTVDREFPGWKERVGFVPTVLTEEAPSSYNCIAVTCGPPIMIKFVLIGLKRLDFEDHQIITTLEKRMKCGIGICGRCNIGTKYVCVDGPVFSYEELRQMVPEI